MLETRVNALNSQFNPHFIYNAMESISSMAMLDDNPRVSIAICSFSELLRQNIRRDRYNCRLYDEIEYIKRYLSVIDIVYPRRVKTNYIFDETIKDFIVPSFILHPILENCIVHGVEKSSHEMEISIECYRLDEMINIIVRDTGEGIDKNILDEINTDLCNANENDDESSNNGMHIGLRNTNQLIKIQYGEHARIKLYPNKPKGLIVDIMIPFKQIRV